MLVTCFAYSLVFQWWMTFFFKQVNIVGVLLLIIVLIFYNVVVIFWNLLYFPFSEKMVSKTASTLTGGRLLRSSTKTNTLGRVPFLEGSLASISKKSLKWKFEKISSTINREGENEFDELDGIVPLKVRITLHSFYGI